VAKSAGKSPSDRAGIGEGCTPTIEGPLRPRAVGLLCSAHVRELCRVLSAAVIEDIAVIRNVYNYIRPLFSKDVVDWQLRWTSALLDPLATLGSEFRSAWHQQSSRAARRNVRWTPRHHSTRPSRLVRGPEDREGQPFVHFAGGSTPPTQS
jgi:hypothetical protein